jgi:hypothetical protein
MTYQSCIEYTVGIEDGSYEWHQSLCLLGSLFPVKNKMLSRMII